MEKLELIKNETKGNKQEVVIENKCNSALDVALGELTTDIKYVRFVKTEMYKNCYTYYYTQIDAEGNAKGSCHWGYNGYTLISKNWENTINDICQWLKDKHNIKMKG